VKAAGNTRQLSALVYGLPEYLQVRRNRKIHSAALTLMLSPLFVAAAPAQTSPVSESFLGLTAPDPGGLWEGRTDYKRSVRPIGKLRAIMLFAHFPDTTVEETTTSLYERLAPEGIAFFDRASYGKMSLKIDTLPRWISMDHASTWPNYSCREFQSHKTYLSEVIRKAASGVDFTRYDFVYVVGSHSLGMPNSPTFGAPAGQGIQIQGTEICHAVTFGNDIRGDRWGWQTLAHETGHMFSLPDLCSFNYSQPYKGIQRYVGFWDLMGFQAIGSEYLAWQKRKLDWLGDRDFVIATSTTEATISPIYDKDGQRAVVVPINPSEAYVAEVRSRDGKPQSEIGVLLYRVSLKNEPGKGPIRIIPNKSDGINPPMEQRFITLYNALFYDGLMLDNAESHFKIEITGRKGRAYNIRVTR